MTEREFVTQLSFDNDAKVVGDMQTLVECVFERHPETRDDIQMLYFFFWLEHNGMRAALKHDFHCHNCGMVQRVNLRQQFEHWYRTKARAAATIERRQRELQNDDKKCLPSPEVQRDREIKSHQGAVRW